MASGMTSFALAISNSLPTAPWVVERPGCWNLSRTAIQAVSASRPRTRCFKGCCRQLVEGFRLAFTLSGIGPTGRYWIYWKKLVRAARPDQLRCRLLTASNMCRVSIQAIFRGWPFPV